MSSYKSIKKMRKIAILKSQEQSTDQILLYAMDRFTELSKEAEWMSATWFRRKWYGNTAPAKKLAEAQIWAAVYKAMESFKAVIETKTR